MNYNDNYTPRKITFGKYKGEYILNVIAEHPGYIMWCFENLHWFRLDSIEQKFYDWTAIAIKKYHCPMIFPTAALYKHVSDRTALEQLETPIQYYNSNPFMSGGTELDSVLRKVGCLGSNARETHTKESEPWWGPLQSTTARIVNAMSDEEIQDMVNNGCTPPFAF